MLNIDFLPDSYRRESAMRYVKLWQLSVLMLFATAIASAAYYQYSLRRGLDLELAAVEPQVAQAHKTELDLVRVQSELAQVRHEALLAVYTRHPWPRTQLIAAVAENLPPKVQLTSLTILRETVQGRRFAQNENSAAGDNDTQELPAQRDLRALRDRFDGQAVIAQVEGNTTDPSQLHQYIGRLDRFALVKNAELESFEVDPQQSGRSLFQIRLTILPGHAQPGGPTQSLVGMSTVNSEGQRRFFSEAWPPVSEEAGPTTTQLEDVQ